jgi:nitrate/TMAO reductase-like tetraheme cytochrome c subunit
MLRAVHVTWLGIVAIGAALAAATILIFHLVKKPALTVRVKLWLLLGLGVFPVLAAATSTVAGMEATTERKFCGSCHVMDAHFQDTRDPQSQSLAARHSRNAFFGDRSCYVCHADYGMYGYAMTKAGGMRHVYEYYLGGYGEMTLEEAKQAIHLLKPYDNLNCRQCHTTSLHDWRRVPEHESLKTELMNNTVSCASAGCHGYAHPFTKTAQRHGAEPVTPPLQKATIPSGNSRAPAAATGGAR